MNWTRVLRAYCLMGAMRAPVCIAPRRLVLSPGARAGMELGLFATPGFSNAHTPRRPVHLEVERLAKTYPKRCAPSA